MGLSNTALTVLVLLGLALSILALYLLVRVATREGTKTSLRTLPPDKQVEALVDTHAKAMETDGEKARLIPISTSTEPNKVEASA